MKALPILLLVGLTLQAQDIPRFRTWKASVVAVGISQAMDIASSYQRPGFEANPLFGDTVTGRDVAIKVAGVAGIILLQRYVIRRHPDTKAARLFSVINFSTAGIVTGAAIRNWQIPR